jgi:Capsule polysaccharide biosynthesis protein
MSVGSRTEKKSVGVLITNPNHHWAMVCPIVRELIQEGRVRPVLISLCGLRRMKDPLAEYDALGVDFRLGPDLTRFGLKSSSGQESLGGGGSSKRRLIQKLTWILFLKSRLTRLLAGLHGIFLLNDQAFPVNLLMQIAKSRCIWRGMLQEGIRFPLPNESAENRYGCSDLDVLFAWGQHSANYFDDKLKSHATRVVISGNPRYYELLQKDWTPEAKLLLQEQKSCGPIIGLATNPIDDQGFCSTHDKWKVVRAFLAAATSVLRSNNGQLWIKCHPRESLEEYEKLSIELYATDIVRIIHSRNIFPFLQAVDRTVVLASTVGLESLAMNKPLAVLPIPGHGYVHDYVESNVAVPLDLDCLATQLSEWLTYTPGSEEARYVVANLSSEQNPSHVIRDNIVNAILP